MEPSGHPWVSEGKVGAEWGDGWKDNAAAPKVGPCLHEKPPHDMIQVGGRPWKRLMPLEKGEASHSLCAASPSSTGQEVFLHPQPLGQSRAALCSANGSKAEPWLCPSSSSANSGWDGEHAPIAFCLSSQVKVTLASRLKKINGLYSMRLRKTTYIYHLGIRWA